MRKILYVILLLSVLFIEVLCLETSEAEAMESNEMEFDTEIDVETQTEYLFSVTEPSRLEMNLNKAEFRMYAVVDGQRREICFVEKCTTKKQVRIPAGEYIISAERGGRIYSHLYVETSSEYEK